MQVNIETPSALRRKVTIELEPDEIRHELDSAYNELRRNAHLKGFRPGHAPRNLLERYFGEQVRTEVVQKLIRESTEKALKDHELSPVVDPEIVTEESDLSKSLKFSAVFDVKPEITVKDYEGLKVPTPKIEVSDKDVDAALERLRERLAPLKKVEGRTAVQPGDFAIVELEAFDGGKAIAGSKVESRLLQVTDQTLTHGLHEVLAGAEVGKPFVKPRSYPADYSEKDLAGKSVEWRGTVKDIFYRALPNLDDEFAKDSGQCDTLEELRVRIRDDLGAQAKREGDARVRQGLLDIVIERNPIEVPDSLVAHEQQVLEAEIHNALEAAGMSHEQAAERAQANRDDLRTRAEKRARSALIIDAIAEQEKIAVDDEALGRKIAELVTQAGRDRERAAKLYAGEEHREGLRRAMRRERTLDLLLSRAQIEGDA